MRHVVALGLGLILIGQNATSWAAPAEEESTPAQVAYGAGSVLGTHISDRAQTIVPCVFRTSPSLNFSPKRRTVFGTGNIAEEATRVFIDTTGCLHRQAIRVEPVLRRGRRGRLSLTARSEE